MASEKGVMLSKSFAGRTAAVVKKVEGQHSPAPPQYDHRKILEVAVELELTQMLVGNHFAKAKIVDNIGFSASGSFNEAFETNLQEEEFWVKGYTEIDTDKWAAGRRALCIRQNGVFIWAIPKGCPTSASDSDKETGRTQTTDALMELYGYEEGV